MFQREFLLKETPGLERWFHGSEHRLLNSQLIQAQSLTLIQQLRTSVTTISGTLVPSSSGVRHICGTQTYMQGKHSNTFKIKMIKDKKKKHGHTNAKEKNSQKLKLEMIQMSARILAKKRYFN